MNLKYSLFLSFFLLTGYFSQAQVQLELEPDTTIVVEFEEDEEEADEYDSVIVSPSEKYWDFIRAGIRLQSIHIKLI
jgi:hypothetical protein